MNYVETDCTITHDGHTFESGGARVNFGRAIAYAANDASMLCGEVHTLTDWHGNALGTFTVKSRKPGAYRHQYTYYISARVKGIDYYGTTQGNGMIAFLKAYKQQRGA